MKYSECVACEKEIKNLSHGFLLRTCREDSLDFLILCGGCLMDWRRREKVRFDAGQYFITQISNAHADKGYMMYLGLRTFPFTTHFAKEALSLSMQTIPSLIKPNYVYIMQLPETDIFKIGKSNNPAVRLSQIKVQLGIEPILVHTIQARTQHLASRVEYILHHIFNGKRIPPQQQVGREWFKLNGKDLDYLRSLEYIENLPMMLGDWIEDHKYSNRKRFFS